MNHIKRHTISLLCVLLAAVLAFGGLGLSASASVPVNGPDWDQEIVDKAVATALGNMNVDINFQWKTTLHISEAFYLLSLMSYYNPNLTSSGGVKVSDRTLEHILQLISGGKEPSCRGALSGWIDGPVSQAFALAKHTPAVWNQLSKQEKEKVDFIMSYMAVVFNYHQNYLNNPKKDLSQKYDAQKGWNPNMQEGGIHTMIAAYLYFGGADKVNEILANFSYDEYIAKMDEYGFTNVKYFFELTGKELLEEGGIDAGGGVVKGAKLPFTYMDTSTSEEIPYDPYLLFRSTALRQFCHVVSSTVYDGRGYIGDGSTSPYEGRMGMCMEFKAQDGNGIRTDAHYVTLSLRNTIPTRATLEALGYWNGDDRDEIDELMYVGIGDYFYKVDPEHEGYYGHQKGHDTHQVEQNFNDQGHEFYKQVWFKAARSDYSARYTISGNSLQITYRNFLLDEIELSVLVTEYDGDGKLVALETQPYTITGETAIQKINLDSVQQNGSIQVFIMDREKGLIAAEPAN